MKISLRKTILLYFILLVGLMSLATAEEAAIKPINKPWGNLSEEEMSINRIYLASKIGGLKQAEKLSFLLSLLDDQKTYFLPREALIQFGTFAKAPLREIVADRERPMTTRAEALVILKELGDRQIISVIDEDPILRKPITAYEEIHAPEVVEFQKNYLFLKMAKLRPSEKVEFLIDMLKERKCDYLVRDELIALGKEITSSLIEILSNKKNPYLIRQDALFILKEIGDEACVLSVTNVLTDDAEKDQMRELAAVTLGIVGNESSIPILEEVSRTWRPKEKTPSHVDINKAAKKAIIAIRKKVIAQ